METLSRTSTAFRQRQTLKQIEADATAALDAYRDRTLDAIEAVAAWQTHTGRRDFWYGGAHFLATCCNDLHFAAFRRQPLQYLVGIDTAFNPLALPGPQWHVAPPLAAALGAAEATRRQHDRAPDPGKHFRVGCGGRD